MKSFIVIFFLSGLTLVLSDNSILTEEHKKLFEEGEVFVQEDLDNFNAEDKNQQKLMDYLKKIRQRAHGLENELTRIVNKFLSEQEIESESDLIEWDQIPSEIENFRKNIFSCKIMFNAVIKWISIRFGLENNSETTEKTNEHRHHLHLPHLHHLHHKELPNKWKEMREKLILNNNALLKIDYKARQFFNDLLYFNSKKDLTSEEKEFLENNITELITWFEEVIYHKDMTNRIDSIVNEYN